MSRKSTIKEIGIIGNGRFGSLLAEILSANLPEIQIMICDKENVNASFQEVANCKVIFVCVPISEFEKVIKKLSKQIRLDATVLDVCSVKVHPVKVMIEHLPSTVNILATHPLFGPNSFDTNKKVVIWPVRIAAKNQKSISSIFTKLGLEVIKMNPETHDKLIAFSQGFTHLVGRIGQRIGIEETPIDTSSFQNLLATQKIVTSDSEKFFIDMQKFNPFTKGMRSEIKKALIDIEKNLTVN